MLFEEKKLNLESVQNMYQCQIYTVEPFTLMLAPVYVLMKLNQKLVSVKAPLDFFTPDEIQRLKVYEVFYFPNFAKSSVRFQTAARVVKKILSLKKEIIEPAPFEISKEVFLQLAPLWGKEMFIEPFFAAVFSDHLCEPLDSKLMIWGRENSVAFHDHGLLLSGSVVFFLLHLGWFDLPQLNRIRSEIYSRTVKGEEWTRPTNELEMIVSCIHQMICRSKSISLRDVEFAEYDFFRKIFCRVRMWSKINTNHKHASESIYGEGGFAA